MIWHQITLKYFLTFLQSSIFTEFRCFILQRDATVEKIMKLDLPQTLVFVMIQKKSDKVAT